MPTAYLGLGANLGDRRANLERAVAALAVLGPVRRSSWLETEPEEMPGAPRFLNGVASLETTLGPSELLERTAALEAEYGRDPEDRGGPRTLDIDLLLYGQDRVDEPGLRVPHPRLAGRGFVLEPLAELDPDVRHPETGQTAARMLQELRGQG
jgi:2-amino-4-hydroxy-6-hydroxymethyldihydropteridine diphosphokinase